MVTANECTRHICCSRKNSLFCAKSTSMGRSKNKLWAGSIDVQINSAWPHEGTFIPISWCGLKKVRQWMSWSGSKGSPHTCLCHSITDGTIKLPPFSLSLSNYIGKRIVFITSEMRGNWQIILPCINGLKNNNDKSINSPSVNDPPQHALSLVPLFLKSFVEEPFGILDHAVQQMC